MKKIKIAILLLIVGVKAFAQNTFVDGYFINNSGEKTNCLIKNMDWLNNPTEFDYKISDSLESKRASINEVKEFGIANISKYIRQNVDIDRTSSEFNELDYSRAPVFNTEKLFLKVLVEGKACLYSYEDKGLVRYFFKKDTSSVQQLVHKLYLSDSDPGTFKNNNQFRQQLLNSLQNEKITIKNIKTVKYKESSLTRLFVRYNESSNTGYVNYKETKEKNLYHLTLRPAMRTSSLELFASGYYNLIDFGEGIGSYSFGLESEFVLGFNNNKWSFLLEQTYQQFQTEVSYVRSEITGQKIDASFEYESIEIALGFRHYIYLNPELKLFANFSVSYDLILNSHIEPLSKNDILNGFIYMPGIGCKFKDRYSLEMRYFINRDLFNNNLLDTNFRSLSFILGYSIF